MVGPLLIGVCCLIYSATCFLGYSC